MPKPHIRKPTHHLVAGGIVYADIRCGDFKPAIRLRSTGETVRADSSLMDGDLLMGKWHNAVWFLFGLEGNHIPDSAKMVDVAAVVY